MSETVLDVLMYLFETYSEQDLDVEPEPDQSESCVKNCCMPVSVNLKSTERWTGSTV